MPQRFLVEQAKPGAIECRFAPASVDGKARTAEVVWTTGARVLRRSFRGDYLEELEVTPRAVRLDRLNSGSAPLLDTHDTFDLDSVIGVVERASIKSGEGRAVVKFSDRNDRAREAFQGVREGVIRNVSVGYIVHKAEETEASEDSPAIRRAIDWEPVELSFVPVGADAGAGVRASERAQSNDCVVIHRTEESAMRARLTDREFNTFWSALSPTGRATLEKIGRGQAISADEARALVGDLRDQGVGGLAHHSDAELGIGASGREARHRRAQEQWRRVLAKQGRLNQAAVERRDIIEAGSRPGATPREQWRAVYAKIGRLKKGA